MGKEERTSSSPQIIKRTTRSSSATPSKGTLETRKICDPPSISNDLLFTESISLDDLLSNFPGRRLQILEILRLIGPPNSPMVPLFLYGNASTGKTSAVLQIFKHLNRPFVYSSCASCYNPRILFESVLNQLLLHRRNTSNGYSSAKRCERGADFVNMLRDALCQTIESIKECSKRSGSKELVKQCNNGTMVYLIFDNVEFIRGWDKKSIILPLLFNIYDILKIPEIGLIFISSSSPESYHLNTDFIKPLPVFFPDYTEDDLYHIFMRIQSNTKLYSSFLSVVLKPFCRITRRVDELSIALSPLFQKYCEPLDNLESVPEENAKRRLFNHLQPYLSSALNETFKFPSQPTSKTNKEKVRKKGNLRKSGYGEACDELDFHMPVSAKYLLISAFLASRNPATLDAALFDSTGGSDNRKRKRKSSEASIEKKDDVAQELLKKGPGTFPLERLLAIFQCITSVAECPLNMEQEERELSGDRDVQLMSDVLLQLSTLCCANFISKGGSCPLEGSTRYRSTVDEETALKVARSVNFPLSKYLYRR